MSMGYHYLYLYPDRVDRFCMARWCTYETDTYRHTTLRHDVSSVAIARISVMRATRANNNNCINSHKHCRVVETRRRLQQVCVGPPSSALNMTLPAFAAERRRLQQMSTDSSARSYRSISADSARAQQQTGRTPPLLSIDATERRTDGQTDGHRTLHRSRSAYCAGGVNNKLSPRGRRDDMPPPFAVRLAADLRPSADGSSVCTWLS